MPDAVGMSLEDAQDELFMWVLVGEHAGEEESDYEVGTVCRQEPAPHSVVPVGSVVYLWTSQRRATATPTRTPTATPTVIPTATPIRPTPTPLPSTPTPSLPVPEEVLFRGRVEMLGSVGDLHDIFVRVDTMLEGPSLPAFTVLLFVPDLYTPCPPGHIEGDIDSFDFGDLVEVYGRTIPAYDTIISVCEDTYYLRHIPEDATPVPPTATPKPPLPSPQCDRQTYQYEGGYSLEVDHVCGPPGDVITVSGSGFDGELAIQLHACNPVVLLGDSFHITGTFSVQRTIPADTCPGTHQLILISILGDHLHEFYMGTFTVR